MAIWVCSYIMIHVLQRERERDEEEITYCTRRASHYITHVHST